MPYDVYTKALLHMDGADGSEIFIEETGLTVTVVSGAGTTHTMAIDTAVSVFGGASASFTRANGDRLELPGAGLALGTGDYVIDFRLRRPETDGYLTDIVDFRGLSAAVPTNFTISLFGTFIFWHLGGGGDPLDFTPVNANQWVHIALIRSSGGTRLFIDGFQADPVTYNDTADYAAPPEVVIGGQFTSGNGLNGWIDEFRISIGTDRGWFNGFTPPTEAYAEEIVIPPEPEVPPTALPGGGSGRWTEERRPTPQRLYTEEELREIEEARRIREQTKREREAEIRQAVERAFAELTGEPLPADTDQDIAPPAVPSEAATARRLDSDLVSARNVEALDRILERLSAQFTAIEKADIEYRLAQRLVAIEDDEAAAILLLG